MDKSEDVLRYWVLNKNQNNQQYNRVFETRILKLK